MNSKKELNGIYRFQVVVKAFVTNRGEILVGKNSKDENGSGDRDWQLIGGYVEPGEELEESIEQKIQEKTGLKVNTHQIVDVISSPYAEGDNNSIQIVYHCQTEKRSEEAKGKLETLKWVAPENMTSEVGNEESQNLNEREEQANFLEKLQKLPTF